MNKLNKFKILPLEYNNHYEKLYLENYYVIPLNNKEITFFKNNGVKYSNQDSSSYIVFPYKKWYIDIYLDKIEDDYYYVWLNFSATGNIENEYSSGIGNSYYYKLDQFLELKMFITIIKDYSKLNQFSELEMFLTEIKNHSNLEKIWIYLINKNID